MPQRALATHSGVPGLSRVFYLFVMAYRGIDAAARENQYGPATDLSRWSLEVNEGQQVSEPVSIYRN